LLIWIFRHIRIVSRYQFDCSWFKVSI